MQKKIEIDEDRRVYYAILKGNPYAFQIRDEITKDGYADKSYYITRDKNYEIGGYTVNNGITDLTFEINVSHPWYIPFLDLLGDDNELVIDDDKTMDNNRKYLKITKEGNAILLRFVNNYSNNKNKFSHDRFNVSIKNVYHDDNSKLDQRGTDIKYRLHKLFIEINNMMMDNDLENNDIKKYVKKRN